MIAVHWRCLFSSQWANPCIAVVVHLLMLAALNACSVAEGVGDPVSEPVGGDKFRPSLPRLSFEVVALDESGQGAIANEAPRGVREMLQDSLGGFVAAAWGWFRTTNSASHADALGELEAECLADAVCHEAASSAHPSLEQVRETKSRAAACAVAVVLGGTCAVLLVKTGPVAVVTACPKLMAAATASMSVCRWSVF